MPGLFLYTTRFSIKLQTFGTHCFGFEPSQAILSSQESHPCLYPQETRDFVRMLAHQAADQRTWQKLELAKQNETMWSSFEKTLRELQNAAQRTSNRLSRCQNVLTKRRHKCLFFYKLKFVKFQVWSQFEFCHNQSFVTNWVLDFCHDLSF